MQLVVYACLTDRIVAGLGLFNVDSKMIGIDGAGPAIADIEDWQDALDQMLKMGQRVEQQAFAKHGLNFVIDTYLPEKLAAPRKFLP